jgi:6-phosphogluconolactonase/glucosamine-6-phosphate isomerase/deaminase
LPKKIEEYTYTEFCKLVGGDSQYAKILYEDLLHPSENEWSDCIQIFIDDNVLNEKQKEQIQKEARKFILEKISQVKKDSTLYEVEYCDEGGGPSAYMEHEYMPYLKITKERISHH